MVDFHTHILPGIDDGSQSVSESLTLLEMLRRQGIRAVVATPHFYADSTNPRRFLEERRCAWQQLQAHLRPELPEVYLGAEVQYFEGIGKAEEIGLLKIEGSDLLLLEMPLQRWTHRMIDDVLALSGQPDLQVVLAHVERYLSGQPGEIWQSLYRNGVLMQSNVSFFADWKTRCKAMTMLKKGRIHLLGSDCHNETDRPPNWDRLPRKAVRLVKDSDSYLSLYKQEENRIFDVNMQEG